MDEEEEDEENNNNSSKRVVPAGPKKPWVDMNEEERYVEKKKNELLARFLGVVQPISSEQVKRPAANAEIAEQSLDKSEAEKREMLEEIIAMQKEWDSCERQR